MFRGAVVWCWAGGTREVWKAVVSPPVSPWNCRTLVRRPEVCSVGVVTLITRVIITKAPVIPIHTRIN